MILNIRYFSHRRETSTEELHIPRQSKVSVPQRRPCFDDVVRRSNAILRYLRDSQSMESNGHANITILRRQIGFLADEALIFN